MHSARATARRGGGDDGGNDDALRRRGHRGNGGVAASAPAAAAAAAAKVAAALWDRSPNPQRAVDGLPGSVSWRVGHPPPRHLTNAVMHAPSPEQLISVAGAHGVAFNSYHCSAFWIRLGRLVSSDREHRRWLRNNEHFLAESRENTLRLLPTFGPRQLSGTAHGAATAGVGGEPPWYHFWSRLAATATQTLALRDFESQDLVMLTSAFATAGVEQPALFDAAALEAMERLAELELQHVALLAWSFSALPGASGGGPGGALLSCLATAAAEQLDAFDARDLSRVALALSRVDAGAPALAFFAGLAEMLERDGGRSIASTQSLGTLVHALGRGLRDAGGAGERRVGASPRAALLRAALARVAHWPLFALQGAARRGVARIGRRRRARRRTPSAGLEAPNLVRLRARTPTPSAAGASSHSPTSSGACGAAAGRLGRFTERELSSCRGRSAARPLGRRRPLLEAIAEESAERLHEFKPGGLVCLAWSHSRAVTRRDGGDARGSKSGGGGRGSRSRSCAVDEGAWPASVTLLDLLAEEVCARGNELSRSEIRSIEMSYAHLRRPNPFSVVGDHLHGTPLDADDAQEGETLY